MNISDKIDDAVSMIASGGKRDMMYDVNNAIIAAMIADTDYFSFGSDPAANNLYYALSSEVHQTMMARLYFYNALKVVFH